MPPQPPPLRSSILRPIYTHLSSRSSQSWRPSSLVLHCQIHQLPSQHPYSTKRTPSPTLRTTKATRAPSQAGGSNNTAPRTTDRGPASKEETQTDFGALDVLASMPPPTTAIDGTHPDGFSLNSGIEVAGAGVLLYGGEAFKWRPWVRGGQDDDGGDGHNGNSSSSSSTHSESKGSDKPINTKDVDGSNVNNNINNNNTARSSLRDVSGLLWECGRRAWGVLDVAWPKPDLLIIGTGATIVPISPTTRRHINDLGIRLEVADTRNAASQFNLLATERGVNQVAAALVPVGWKEQVRGGVKARR